MGYAGMTAEPTLEDLAKRLVWTDFARAKLTIVLGGVGGAKTAEEIAAGLIETALQDAYKRGQGVLIDRDSRRLRESFGCPEPTSGYTEASEK